MSATEAAKADAHLPAVPQPKLTLLDCICIIVGIIVGSGIYETTPLIASCVRSTWQLTLVWLLGGALSLVGSLCYAELSTSFPREGGDYAFLTRGFGRAFGFLFAWAQFWIIRPGNIGMMAFVFARYANQLLPLRLQGDGRQDDFVVYASLAVAALTGLNLFGIRVGTWAQNALTLAKIVGLLAIIAIGFCSTPAAVTVDMTAASEVPQASASASAEPANLRLALILVLFAYGGWNEISYVAAEVREPRRNLLRALVLGVAVVTTVYVAANLAFVHSLGLAGVADEVKGSQALAATVVQRSLGPIGARLVSVLICLSCLSAINGMIFTGARVHYAFGREHRTFRWLGRWNATVDAPQRALWLQGLVTLGLVIGFGRSREGFDRLLHFLSPTYWFFLAAVSLTVFLLRRYAPDTERPYRVPGYPLVPLLFGGSCLFMFHASLTYALSNRSAESSVSVVILGVGVLGAALEAWLGRSKQSG